MTDEQVPNGEQQETEESSEEQVTLTAEQYGNLLDRLAEFEDLRTRRTMSVDELAQEGHRPPTRQEPPPQQREGIDWDNLSNKDLVGIIVEEVNKVLHKKGGEIDGEIETLKLLREIDKCEDKYDDFWDYKDRIYQLGVESPGLSIERAYKLAKAETGDQKGDQTSKGKREPVIYGLPPRPKVTPPGEKPSGSTPPSSLSKTDKGDTVRKAAEAAWEEVMGKEVEK